jgi:endonuclease YncB( thermonuclease family)
VTVVGDGEILGTTHMPDRKYPARLQQVHDGDTIAFLWDQGRRTYGAEHVRLLDVWCPELDEPGGAEATRATVEWLALHADERGWYGIQTVKAGTRAEEKRTFTRYLATVYPLTDLTTSLNEHLNLLGYPSERPTSIAAWADSNPHLTEVTR